MTQLALTLDPVGTVDVWLSCPSCGHHWHEATLVPGAWWAAGVTPQSVARVPYCPACQQAPPMRVEAV